MYNPDDIEWFWDIELTGITYHDIWKGFNSYEVYLIYDKNSGYWFLGAHANEYGVVQKYELITRFIKSHPHMKIILIVCFPSRAWRHYPELRKYLVSSTINSELITHSNEDLTHVHIGYFIQ